MLRSFHVLDSLLRGDATRPDALKLGSLQIPVVGLTLVVVTLGLVHGFCVGWYALFNHADPSAQQLLATTVKVPALLLLTLAVTFPSLYVFNALVGSRLRFLSLLRLMVATLAVIVAVLASFGPIVSFFSVSTTSYLFMVLLNVVAFAGAGALGLSFLHQTLARLSVFTAPSRVVFDEDDHEFAADEEDPGVEELGALDSSRSSVLGPHVKIVFLVWMIVFGLVGSQMGWVLRPFIGRPGAEFSWLRPREGNVFEAVLNALRNLLG